MTEELRAKLATKHDELVQEYVEADTPEQEIVILKQISFIECALFYSC